MYFETVLLNWRYCVSFFTLTRKNNESIYWNNYMYDGWSAGYGTAGV